MICHRFLVCLSCILRAVCDFYDIIVNKSTIEPSRSKSPDLSKSFTKEPFDKQSLRLDMLEYTYSGKDVNDLIRIRLDAKDMKCHVETTSNLIVKVFDMIEVDNHDLNEKNSSMFTTSTFKESSIFD